MPETIDPIARLRAAQADIAAAIAELEGSQPAPPPIIVPAEPLPAGGFRFSARSLGFASEVEPKLVSVATLALSRCRVDFGITEDQSRSEAEQAEKVRRGVSKTMNSKHMVKKGAQFSTALDLVPWVGGAFTWGDSMWRVQIGGETIYPFHEIAAAMRAAAIEKGLDLIWGAVWDRKLRELPADVAGLRAAVEAYKVRHPGPDFLDGPHFEIA